MTNDRRGKHAASSPRPQLNAVQAGTVERAREVLAAARADGNPENFGQHLGRLEASLELVFEVIDELTGGGS